MSGGSLGYFYNELEDHANDLGDRELNELVKDLAGLFHAREWYLSADTREGDWVEQRNAFKEKWFKEGARAKRIQEYMEQIRKEVLDSFGISEEYCKNCSSWTKEEDEESPYGRCKHRKGCMMHQSETCEKFSARDA